jgi:hypothetical protein
LELLFIFLTKGNGFDISGKHLPWQERSVGEVCIVCERNKMSNPDSFHTVAIQKENNMKETYVLRQSDNLVFNDESETFTFAAKRLTDAKRRAIRKQFHEDSNLRLEDENGNVISIKRSGCKWEDKV